MKLNAPTRAIWIIALVLGVLALLGQLAIPALAPYAFWLALIGLIVLLLATVFAKV